jgi:hypothetical protein
MQINGRNVSLFSSDNSLQMIVASEGDFITFVWSYSFTFTAKQSKSPSFRHGMKGEFFSLEYQTEAEEFTSTPNPPRHEISVEGVARNSLSKSVWMWLQGLTTSTHSLLQI